MPKKHLIKTEQDVLNRIGAPDFRSISKEQIIQFVSEIPNMDKEVAITCIEQFPEFANYSQEIVKSLYLLYNSALDDHKASRKSAIEAYQSVLDNLNNLSQQSNLSIKDQQYFINQSVEIADKIADLHRDNAEFLEKVMKAGATVGGMALAVAGAVLGVKFIDGKKQ